MDDEHEKQILERLAELPEDVRNAVQSAELSKKTHSIGIKYKLHLDQVGELEDETLMVMLGFIPASKFESRLAEHLRITPDVAKLLIADINTEIFLPIQESMRKFIETNAAAPAAPATPAPAIHPADIILSQKTVTAASSVTLPANTAQTTAPTLPAPLKPQPYTTDPYREPTE